MVDVTQGGRGYPDLRYLGHISGISGIYQVYLRYITTEFWVCTEWMLFTVNLGNLDHPG